MYRFFTAIVLCLVVLNDAAAEATIERFGPDQRVEITTDTMFELGVALATVQADESFCKLAQMMTFYGGQAARYLSPSPTNIAQDIMERARRPEREHLMVPANGPDQFVNGPTHHQDELDFLAGYVDGYNTYRKQKKRLRERHPACADAPIANFKLEVRHLAHSQPPDSCSPSYDTEILAAQPPASRRRSSLNRSELAQISPRRRNASTNWAFGSDLTVGAKSILFDAPHDSTSVPETAFRLRVAGKFDSFVRIYTDSPTYHSWTNGKVAGGITCHYGQVYAVYRLTLAPNNPTQYVVDGVTKQLEERNVSIKVRDSNGHLKTRRHTVYRSDFGFVMSSDDYPWDDQHAFAIREVHEGLPSLLFHPYHPMIYNAETAEELVQAYRSLERNEAVQLSAIDHEGNVASTPNSVVINLDNDQWSNCAVYKERGSPKDLKGLPILDGTRSQCALKTADDRHAPGVMALSEIPYHVTKTALMDSNQSVAWTNPRQPIKGFSPLIDGYSWYRTGRARYLGHRRILDARANSSDGYPGNKWSFETLWDRYTDGESYWAARFKDSVVQYCTDAKRVIRNGIFVDLREACGVLDAWDGKTRARSRGYLLWSVFWSELPDDGEQLKVEGFWIPFGGLSFTKDVFKDAFDPARPYDTPSDFDPKKVNLILGALARAVEAFALEGIPLNISIAEGQTIVVAGKRIPLPGCQASDICENIQSKSGPVTSVLRQYTDGTYLNNGAPRYKGSGTNSVIGLLGNGRVRVRYGGPWWGADTHPSRGIQTLAAEKWARGEGFDIELQLSE
ncbi:MAG: penicillin acylase family protein [Pseudomonadota bacterium]